MYFLVAVALVCMSSNTRNIEAQASPLEGAWVAESIEREGKTATARQAGIVRFTFAGERLVIRGLHGRTHEETSPFTINMKASPKWLDYTRSTGIKVLGLYDLDGDRLRVAVRPNGGERPKSLESPSGSGILVITLRRVRS